MKLSVFTTASNPTARGDMFNEAINCYTELADEVIVVDGGNANHLKVKAIPSYWPYDFEWDFIGKQFQNGYEAATGDWVIHADLDFLFHENDFESIKQALGAHPQEPALSFYKWQFILPDRYNLKSRLVIAVNKAKFGDRIRFDSGGDLCQPSLDGKEIKPDDVPEARIPIYNYEKLSKTFPQIIDDIFRMDKAYTRTFDKFLYSEDGSQMSAYLGWLKMMTGRFNKPSKQIPISEHPKYIQQVINSLTPQQWGYDGLGHLERNSYVESSLRSR